MVEHKTENLGVVGSNPTRNTVKVNFLLILKYILGYRHFISLDYSNKVKNELSVFVSLDKVYYLSFFFKFSTFFYSTQLIELFSYVKPGLTNLNLDEKVLKNIVVVYLFHNVFFQKRIYLFSSPILDKSLSLVSLLSISELFTNSGWLERECSELSGIVFFKKKDTRNLMLPYSDNSKPLQKNYPSIGLKEIFYDLQSDFLIHQSVNIQF